MQRAVDASTVVAMPVAEAHDLLLGDPTGIVGPPSASAIGETLHVEVGVPRHEDDAVRVPVHVRSLDGGPLRELIAELVVLAAGAGALVELQGSYRWEGREGYGGGVLAHRVARWLARDLVDGVGARLLAGAEATG